MGKKESRCYTIPLFDGEVAHIVMPEVLTEKDWNQLIRHLKYLKPLLVEQEDGIMEERIYSVSDGEAIVRFPTDYSAQSVEDLIGQLTLDKRVRERIETKASINKDKELEDAIEIIDKEKDQS